MMRGAESRRTLRATKMGSGLPWPSGSSLRSHPASTAVIRSSGSSAWILKHAFGLARGEALGGAFGEAALEFGQRCGGQSKANGEGVAAEAREEIGAGFDGVEQLESVDGAAGAVRDAVFNADDDGGLGGAFDDARSEDADDAAMPAVAVDDEQARGGKFGVGGEARLDGGECAGFGFAAFAIEAFELVGEFGGAGGVAGAEELDDVGGHVHAAGGVDARREAEGDVEAGERLGCGIELGGGEERAQARADRACAVRADRARR